MRSILLFLLIFGTSFSDDFNVIDIADFGDINISEFENITLNYDIKAICANFTDRPGIVNPCRKQLNIVCQNLTLLFTMLDASSKFPYPGFQTSTRLDFGNYDECIRIDHVETFDNESVRILGKHCTPGFVIPVVKNENDSAAIIRDSFKLSICIPDKCTSKDLQNITGLPLFTDEGCSTNVPEEMRPGHIIIMIIFTFFLCIVTASTMYDVYLHKNNEVSSNPNYLAFSLLSNGRKLFQTSAGNNEQILIFHGLKFISMLWIIAGHVYSGWSTVPLINENMALEWWNEKMYSFYITSAYLAVDTFFFISGFLFAYQYLKQECKSVKEQIKNIPLLYIHRYLRLTPALLMIYLCLVGIIVHLDYGPLKYAIDKMFISVCYTNWWSMFLYVQNYYSPEDWCMVNTWYLCADMQLFVLAPFVAIPVASHIKNNFKQTMIALFFMNLFFTILPLINVIWQDLYFNQYATHARLIDYGIGFMMGAYMRETKHKPLKLNNVVNLVIWIVAIVTMLAVLLVYKAIDINYGYVPHQVFFSFMRPVWCIGLCWIVFSCCHGYGGIVSNILTLPLFQIGSKLTYSMYLIHVPMFVVYIATTRQKKFFSDYNAFYEFCGVLIVTLIISIFWCLTFESPIITLEKVIFGVAGKKANNGNSQEPRNLKSKEMSMKE